MAEIVTHARTPALTCPYCRLPVGREAPCACGAVYHRDCRAALGRCATLGCDATARVGPAPKPAPRVRRRLALLATRPEVDPGAGVVLGMVALVIAFAAIKMPAGLLTHVLTPLGGPSVPMRALFAAIAAALMAAYVAGVVRRCSRPRRARR